MSALVAGYGNSLRIFLDSGFNDFLRRAVMTQMDNFCSLRLHHPAHDIDSRIVAVKKRGGGYYSYFMFYALAQVMNLNNNRDVKLADCRELRVPGFIPMSKIPQLYEWWPSFAQKCTCACNG